MRKHIIKLIVHTPLSDELIDKLRRLSLSFGYVIDIVSFLDDDVQNSHEIMNSTFELFNMKSIRYTSKPIKDIESLLYEVGFKSGKSIDNCDYEDCIVFFVGTNNLKSNIRAVNFVNQIRMIACNYKDISIVIDENDLDFTEVKKDIPYRRYLATKAFDFAATFDKRISNAIASDHFGQSSGKRLDKVMVIGSGGREHAIVHSLCKSKEIGRIVVCPGNAGTSSERMLANSKLCENISDINAENVEIIVAFAKHNAVDYVVVGPEQPLVQGLCDELRKKGIGCFGPSAKAAVIEGSKAWSKEFMQRHNIRTAQFEKFTDFDEARHYLESVAHRVVVKASGLAAGKGVVIPTSTDEAIAAARSMLIDLAFGDAGREIVIEEFIVGEEVSVLAFCDGTRAIGMPAAQDHKRVFDGDGGPNTGGMGAYAPTPLITPWQYNKCMAAIQRTVDGMQSEGIPFEGVLYAGFIIPTVPPANMSYDEESWQEPVVLEYNCRFGDPETQVLLPLLQSDLYRTMRACSNKELCNSHVMWKEEVACTVVCAAGGYPGQYERGLPISGLDVESENTKVYHAGTMALANEEQVVSSNGGRVIAVSGMGKSLKQAVDAAYIRLGHIHFDGMHYRKDIARRGLQKPFRLGVIGSTRGTDMQAIIDAIEANLLHARIVLVVSNKEKAGILERAKKHKLKQRFISSAGCGSREEYDVKVSEAFDAEGVELVLMIGYMRIVSPLFVQKWKNRCINVHPSLLPEFAGGMDLEVHAAVIQAKRPYSGCTIHFVTDEVDGGPIILQKKCQVNYPNETAESLKEKVQQLEGEAFIEAIRLLSDPPEELLQQIQSESNVITYKSSGVDIDAGEALVERIKPFCKMTRRSGCDDLDLAGFGGLFDLKGSGFGGDDTILVSGTDGVGTKLKIAQAIGKHDTIGIDLVAMCVNDVLVCGAEPLFFLDYYATGALNVEEAADVVKGIAQGCFDSGCALIGGETAEMAGMYSKGEYDLAGFCVGAVRRGQILPWNVKDGDVVIGLPSSGVHSNGFSLVRKCVERSGVSWQDPPPFQSTSNTLGEALLVPTMLYVKLLLPFVRQGRIKAMAHITGGGLLDNLPRVLPEGLVAQIDIIASNWTLPPVFKWLQSIANLSQEELLRTFNCGVGMVVIVDDSEAMDIVNELEISLGMLQSNKLDGSLKPYNLGRLVSRESLDLKTDQQVLIVNGPLR